MSSLLFLANTAERRVYVKWFISYTHSYTLLIFTATDKYFISLQVDTLCCYGHYKISPYVTTVSILNKNPCITSPGQKGPASMPVMWPCPGQPTCRKIYLYARGLKAHIPSCKHAQRKKVTYSDALNTMLAIVQQAEDTQRGNITVSRNGLSVFRQPKPTLDRL